MLSAVVFGAGSIGRGFLGQLLFEGGYRTTFVDADADLVSLLNARGGYPLRLISVDETQTLTIGNLWAILASDEAAVTQAIVEADLICTAVGVGVLPRVAPVVGAGLTARARSSSSPVDLFLCENQWHVAALFHDLLLPYIAPDARPFFADHVGLVETVIGRMVPKATDALRAEDPLLILAEPYRELPVAKNALRRSPPDLPGLILADSFEAYAARKLYLHNMGHAALSYLGLRNDHEYIWQCVDDPKIGRICTDAMADVSKALAREYGFEPSALHLFTSDLMRRFANRALGDPVARVAADPRRKLRPNDRLIGAATLCLKHEIQPVALARVIAAAIDSLASQDESRESILKNVCWLAADSPLAKLIWRETTPR